MSLTSRSSIYFAFLMLVYFTISSIILYHVYLTSKIIVDEQFHIPLGILYCNFNFSTWDPKVTTLPGAYIVSAAVLGPFRLCSTLWLRAVNLLASVVNIFLLLLLFKQFEQNIWNNIWSAFTVALLPPLYFFSHVYYTDVVSVLMVLSMLLMYEKDSHYVASMLGLCAIVCRQTNVIWVVFVAARYVLLELYNSVMPKTRNVNGKGIPIYNFYEFITKLRQPWMVAKNMPMEFWLNSLSYAATILTFAMFLFVNGSIVVGDKTAHQARLHLPQLFYFAVFSLIFAWPHFVGEVINFTVYAKRNKMFILIMLVAGLVIVHKNTLVHPYMLADNRHYIFYIWNRFYGKYLFFRYLMVPVYIFAWYVIIKTLYEKFDVTLLFLYLLCTTLVLIPQQLIELRYYFIPYIIFRLHVKNDTNTVFNMVLEFVTYILMNFITFSMFFNKTITWNEYSEPQRLIW